YFKDHMGAHLCQQFDVAAELNRISEAALVRYQDRLSKDICPAFPEWLHERALETPLPPLNLPTPFKSFPAATKIADQKPAIRLGPMGYGVIRLDCQHSGKTGQRLIEAMQLE